MAATGRSAAVGDRSRGCRRRSGWVRPGLGQAGPLLFSRLSGLCVGPGRQAGAAAEAPPRCGDAPVRPGAWGGARRRLQDRPGHPVAPVGQDKGRRPGSSPRPPFPPGSWPSARRIHLQSCQRFPNAPRTSDRSGEQVWAFFFFLTVPTQTLIVISFTLSRWTVQTDCFSEWELYS